MGKWRNGRRIRPKSERWRHCEGSNPSFPTKTLMRNGLYILVIAPEDYPGKRYRDRYVYEHHLVWWQNTGEIIDTGRFVVHHKDEDKHNNEFSNLEKMLRERHSKEHAATAETIELTCDWCQGKFIREARNHRHRMSRGYAHRFCCKSHQVSYQQTYQVIRGG